jgi:hypothetical protein
LRVGRSAADAGEPCPDEQHSSPRWIVEDGRVLGDIDLLDPVLVPCLADNVASARTIEHCGGVLETIRHFEGFSVRRYRIALDGRERAVS